MQAGQRSLQAGAVLLDAVSAGHQRLGVLHLHARPQRQVDRRRRFASVHHLECAVAGQYVPLAVVAAELDRLLCLDYIKQVRGFL